MTLREEIVDLLTGAIVERDKTTRDIANYQAQIILLEHEKEVIQEVYGE